MATRKNSEIPQIVEKRAKFPNLPYLHELVSSENENVVAVKFVSSVNDCTNEIIPDKTSVQIKTRDQESRVKEWLATLKELQQLDADSLWVEEEDDDILFEETSSSVEIKVSELPPEVECPTCEEGYKWSRDSETVSKQSQKSEITYGDLHSVAHSLKCILEDHVSHGFVAIAFPAGIQIPAAILGIMQSGCGFFPLDYTKPFGDSKVPCSILQIQWILCDLSYCESNDVSDFVQASHVVEFDTRITGMSFVLLRLKPELRSSPSVICKIKPLTKFQFAYAIRTSGTTGSRKIVLVPHAAVVPNVLELLEKFYCKPSDTVFGVAPVTFDPFVVDLFVCLASGAKIVYVPNELKLDSQKVALVLLQEKVTFIQCTPSFLLRFDRYTLQNSVLGGRNFLRILLLGGEKFPEVDWLKEFVKKTGDLRIYNIYGVTELSVWASLERVEYKCENTAAESVTLGDSLSFITLKVLQQDPRKSTEIQKDDSDEGELLLGFTQRRACRIVSERYGKEVKPFPLENDKRNRFIQTGDLVARITKEKVTKFLYIGRTDRIVKRSGIRVDLESIEKLVKSTNWFSIVLCVSYGQSIILAVKPSPNCDSTDDINELNERLHEFLKENLYFDYHPDRIIICRTNIRVNDNGKLDIPFLLQQRTTNEVKKPIKITREEFLEIFNTLWNFGTRFCHNGAAPGDERTFIMDGGTSISVNRFVEEFFEKIQHFGSSIHVEMETKLKCDLLTKPYKEVKESFWDIVRRVEFACAFTVSDENGDSIMSASNLRTNNLYKAESGLAIKKQSNNSYSCTNIKLPPTSVKFVSFPIGLCVDAIPAIAEHPIVGEICLVGSHSGILYAFSMAAVSERILHELSRNSESNEEIKSYDDIVVWKKKFPGRIETSVTTYSANFSAYMSCHDGNVHKMSVVTGEIEWSFACETRASPSLSLDGDLLVFCSSSCIFCVDADNGTLRWQISCDDYILQTNSACVSKDAVFISTVRGIRAVSLQNGQNLWEHTHRKLRTSPLLVTSNAFEENLVLVGDAEGTILAVKEKDGSQGWTYAPSSTNDPPNNTLIHFRPVHPSESQVVYTTQQGYLITLNPQTGREISCLRGCSNSRCRPLLMEVGEMSNNKDLRVCLFFNSLDGTIYSRVDDSTSEIHLVINPVQNHAESFSSVSFSPKTSIICLGARDNCIHFVQLQSN